MFKRFISTSIVVFLTISLFFYNWLAEAIATTHTMPTVEKADIYTLVRQNELSSHQLRLLSEQTGLNEEIILKFLKRGRGMELLEYQEAYFAPVLTVSEKTTPLTISEYLVDEKGNSVKGTNIADIQNGDILITKNSRFLGWRNGHVGIVVDAENGLVLEALMLGTNTKLCSIENWEGYPSFQVLRLKKNKFDSQGYIDFKERVASYAGEYLIDIPYDLLAGVGDRFFPSKTVTVHAAGEGVEDEVIIKGTQCAHLVWYAYQQFGIDLDSDGGFFVTPLDIQKSPYLEVIQSYGY